MSKLKNNSDKNADLRKKAEKKLNTQLERLKELSAKGAHDLAQELGTHQIELEMQIEELQRAQEELEASRSKYSDLYDFAPVGYLTFDAAGVIREANLAAAKMLGIERLYLLNKPFSGFLSRDDNDAFRLHCAAILENRTKQTIEVRLKRRDKTEFFALLESVAVENPVGGAVTVRTAMSDITERKRAQEELMASESRFRLIAERSSEIIFQMDLKGMLTYVSPAVAVNGYTPQEVLSKRFSSYVPLDDLKKTEAAFLRVRTGEILSGFETRLLRKDGSSYPAEISAVPIRENGTVTGIQGLCRDITDRRKTEEALRKSNAFNQSIIDSSSDCIKILDLEGRLQYMSSSGQQLLEIRNFDTYLNVPYEEFWKGSDHERVIEAIGKAKQGQSASFQGFCPTAGGTPKWWDVSISPVLGADGQPERLLAVSRDITERKRAEEAIKRHVEELAERNEDLVRFNRIAVDRELRMVELKKEINALCKRIGEQPRYPLDFEKEQLQQ